MRPVSGACPAATPAGCVRARACGRERSLGWTVLCENQVPGHAAVRGAEHDDGGAVARWERENPRSASLNARARRLLPGGVTHDVRLTEPFPLAVAQAEGARKWDLDGHELICYAMGHGALLLGHSHPEVVAAVRAQAGVFFLPGASHELESDWAELVIRLVPSAELVRFTASGTEASLLALRLARAATGRDRIVKLAGHFHGWHDQVAVGCRPAVRPAGHRRAAARDRQLGDRHSARRAGPGGGAGRRATSPP